MRGEPHFIVGVHCRASEGSQAMQQIAAAGMAALLAASHPQAALAKDLVASAQVR